MFILARSIVLFARACSLDSFKNLRCPHRKRKPLSPVLRREWGLNTSVRIIDSSPHQALIAKGQSSKGLLRPLWGRSDI